MLQTSLEGRTLIERNEGCVLHAYRDVVGVLTIGYGCTGKDVYDGEVITQAQADSMLSHRLTTEFEPGVWNALRGTSVKQNQFDAMVSLAFNIGVGGFAGSSVARFHLQGNYPAAAKAFELWDMAGGRILPALLRRREEEEAMYNEDAVSVPIMPQPQDMTSAQQRILHLTNPWMFGADVKRAQEAFGIGNDQRFGPDTEKATIAFQKKHGLEPDGWIGKDTWHAITGVLYP